MADSDAERWDRRFTEEGWRDLPAEYLVSRRPLLPVSGRALDVAGGPGHNAVWLAGCGLTVTLADVSPVALDMARTRAAAAGAELRTILIDLYRDPLPEGPWDVIVCFHYLQRTLFSDMVAAVAPGGLLVVEIATTRNLERHPRPSAEHVLREGEAPSLITGVDIVDYEEGWFEDHHMARLVARRAGAGLGHSEES